MKSLARWISIVAHPFVFAVYLVAVESVHAVGWRRAGLAVALTLLGAVLPLELFLFAQVRRGRASDMDASGQRERPPLFLFAALLLVVLAAVFSRLPGFELLVRGTLGVLALVALGALVNRWLKLSLHLAFAAYVAALLVVEHGGLPGPLSGSALPALVALPLLAWSRITLGRHSPFEVIVGTALGGTLGWLVGAIAWGRVLV